MKFRTDFVTNSSSSSFVCEICGRVESGWDMCVSEAGMVECKNGHIFCEEEMLHEPSRKELIKLILECKYNERYNHQTGMSYTVDEKDLNNMLEDELYEIIKENETIVPDTVCPICQFIEYSDKDLSQYLFMKYGVPRDEVFAEVKKFNKRRKKLYENEYITYVCKKFDLNPTEIVAGWKEQFGSYANFGKYLREG